ncbi:MAG: ParB family chromosome partitioning protein [Yoonia sp.]|jgi:ParB family chromosome partitioning protein
MAKRKRLSPAMLTGDVAPVAAPEVKSSRPPIADVANDAATTNALMELSDKISSARQDGRWIEQIPLDAIKADYLVRDRVVADADDMTALKDSLRAGGQQTAIEVVPFGPDTFGLISGWRRLTALRELYLEGGLGTVLAIVRHPDDAAASYLAMVEENEIRADLSFYERGRVVVKAVGAGAYPSDKKALGALFHAVPRAKRSKIGSFVRVVRALDDTLQFPTELSEHGGLAIAQALAADTGFAARLRKALEASPPQSAGAEQAIITAAIKGQVKAKPPAQKPVTLPSGLQYTVQTNGKITLSGAALGDKEFQKRLIQTLKLMK